MKIRALVAALAMLATPVSATAGIDDLQIDWRIPEGGIDEADLNADKNNQVVVDLVPARLFVPSDDVLAVKGDKLLPAGTPLYLMIGEAFMVCSQTSAPKGFEGRKRRICLRDTDGDGALDSYFTRSKGRSFLAGDKMWFAMNSEIPKQLKSIEAVELTEVDRMEAPEKAQILMTFGAQKNGQVRMGLSVGAGSFFGRCVANRYVKTSDGFRAWSCMTPDFVVLNKALADEDDDRYEYRFFVPKRELAVRFDVVPRLLGARLMNGMYFE